MRAIVDRIVEDFAVCLFGPDELQVNIPLALLPPETGEGSILTVCFELDRDGEARQRERVQSLLNRLVEKGKQKGGKTD